MHILPYLGKRREKGQALLLILLVMSLVLTLVLSTVSKTVTDVEVSKYEDNSVRAFDAAQAGIEKAVVGLVTPAVPVVLNNDASFVVNSGSYVAQGTFLKYPLELYSGESAVFWLVDHTYSNGDYIISCPGSGCDQQNIPTQLAVCWGRNGTTVNSSATPAVFIEFYYSSAPKSGLPPLRDKFLNMNDLSDIRIATASADPNSPVRGNFLPPLSWTGFQNCGNLDLEFATGFKTGIDNKNQELWNFLNDSPSGSNPDGHDYLLLLIKVTILYNTSVPHPVAIRVTGGGNLPDQGILTDSTGTSGDVTRRLVLNQGFPEVPTEFSHVIFSKKNLTK